MAVITGQSGASEEAHQMDNQDQNFWVKLDSLKLDVEKLGYSEWYSERKSLVKRINEVMEEYIRREDKDEEKSYADLGFLRGLMKMLRHYPEDLSKAVKKRLPDIIEYLRINDDEMFDTPEEVIFNYIYVNSPESLGEYCL
jgi:hypothetical protein